MRIADRPEYRSKRKPLTVSADQTVSAVAGAMSEQNYGSAVIIDADRRVTGIFTERDLLHRVVAPGRDPRATRVGDVMTDDVKVATVSDDVVAWMRQMSNERFRHLPVIDDDGRLQQVVSQGDFVSYTWPELLVKLSREVKEAAPRLASPVWQFAGIAAYTLAVIVVVRHAL